MDIENQVHRAAFYLSDNDDFVYQCGHLHSGDVCHVYCKCGCDGFDDVKYICNACHSNSPKVRNILFHQMVSDYLDAAK